MKKHTLPLALLFCLFFTAFAGADLTSGTSVGMNPPILPTPAYIREHGEIEGASNAIERNGDVYFLTSDFNGTLEIQKDNIVLYGNGHKFNRPPDVENVAFWSGGTGFYPSINLTSARNVTIQGIIFEGCYTCLFARGSSELLLVGNEMRGCDTVLYMDDCHNCSVIGNWLHGNDGVGLFVLSSQNLFVSYNNITGTSARRHGAWVSVCDSTFIKNTFADNFIGIYLYGENQNNRISQNNFVNNTNGVAFMNAGPDMCINNVLVNNYWDNVGEDAINLDASNPTDPSPATHPITAAFNSAQYPPPIATASPQTNEPTKGPLQQNQSLLLAASALIIVAFTACTLILYYLKQRKRSCNREKATKLAA